jgi:hypothetical protein
MKYLSQNYESFLQIPLCSLTHFLSSVLIFWSYLLDFSHRTGQGGVEAFIRPAIAFMPGWNPCTPQINHDSLLAIPASK